MKHEHQWGSWLKWCMDSHLGLPGRCTMKRMRFCRNGWCPMGQYRNGRVIVARKERVTT